METKEKKLIRNLSQPITQVEHNLAKPHGDLYAPAVVETYVFISVVVLAEAITVFVGIVSGLILYGALLVSLVNLSYFSKTAAARRIYVAYSLVPLIRMLSLAMPVQLVPLVYRYAMVGIPLGLSTLLVTKFNGLTSLRLSLTRLEWRIQLVIGLFGVPLGVIASLILKPSPDILNNRSLWLVFQQVIFLTVFGSVLEEIIFRGLIQRAMSYSFGFFSTFLSSILYTFMFLGTISPGYMLFYGITGLLLSFAVQITDSIWGSIIAHSLMNIVFLLLLYTH